MSWTLQQRRGSGAPGEADSSPWPAARGGRNLSAVTSAIAERDPRTPALSPDGSLEQQARAAGRVWPVLRQHRGHTRTPQPGAPECRGSLDSESAKLPR